VPAPSSFEPACSDAVENGMKRRTHSGRGLERELPSYGFDLDYRPESYWNVEASINANIKGTWRRKHGLAADVDGPAGPPPAALFADSIGDDLVRELGRIHPSFMGGEDLPDYASHEVEIARVEMASTLGDVISIRARRRRDGAIRCRVVDDCGYATYVLKRRRLSTNPLALGELIELIETTEVFDEDQILRLCYDQPDGGFEAHGLVQVTWREQLVENADPQQAVAFLGVSSEFYPQLAAWFAAAGRAWIAEQDAVDEDDWEDEAEAEV
jgi:hypothetical protein